MNIIDIQRFIISYLEETTSENPVTASTLAMLCNMSEQEIKALISSLMRASDRIIESDSGYYYASDEDIILSIAEKNPCDRRIYEYVAGFDDIVDAKCFVAKVTDIARKQKKKLECQSLMNDALSVVQNRQKETERQSQIEENKRKAEQRQTNPENSKDKFHTFNKYGEPSAVIHKAIVQDIMQTNNLFLLDGKYFYIYENGVYRIDKECTRITELIQQREYDKFQRASTHKQIEALLGTQQGVPMSNAQVNQYPKEWINFPNGFYDLKSGKMIPHNPKYFSINQLALKYEDEEPKSEYMKRYLETSIPDPDDRKMLLQYIGYCFTRSTDEQVFMSLNGLAGTGKSVIVKAIQKIIGADNYSAVTLQQLTQRFYATNIKGKLLNCFADIENAPIKDTGIIKGIVTGDSTTGEQKGVDSYDFHPYCKLLFTANDFPIILGESTAGFYRRLLIVQYNSKPEKRISEDLFYKPNELAYLLYMSVKAYREAIQSGSGIIKSPNCKKQVKQLRADSDSVFAFIQDCCTVGRGLSYERAELYNKYEAYCDNNNRHSKSRKEFCSSLRAKNFGEKRIRGCDYFTGIEYNREKYPIQEYTTPPDNTDFVKEHYPNFT